MDDEAILVKHWLQRIDDAALLLARAMRLLDPAGIEDATQHRLRELDEYAVDEVTFDEDKLYLLSESDVDDSL